MSIVNRRNAVLGWATWKVGKQSREEEGAPGVPAVEERPAEQADDRGRGGGRARGLGALAEGAQAHRGR